MDSRKADDSSKDEDMVSQKESAVQWPCEISLQKKTFEAHVSFSVPFFIQGPTTLVSSYLNGAESLFA